MYLWWSVLASDPTQYFNEASNRCVQLKVEWIFPKVCNGKDSAFVCVCVWEKYVKSFSIEWTLVGAEQQHYFWNCWFVKSWLLKATNLSTGTPSTFKCFVFVVDEWNRDRKKRKANLSRSDCYHRLMFHVVRKTGT